MPNKTAKPPKARHYHVPLKEREYLSENLGLLLQAAVPIGGALESLATTTRSKPMKKALMAMQLDIEAGFSLADALERSGIASGQTQALVRLGEHSGKLAENLKLAAQQEEKRRIFRSKVRTALLYPTFVLFLTLVVGLGVAWLLLPRLASTISQLQTELPLISITMIGIGTFLATHGAIAVPSFLAASALLGYVVFGFHYTKFIGQSLLFHTPGIGRLIRESEIAQFGHLLGTLLDAGLSVTQAINLLAQASGSRQYQRFYRYLAQSLDDGYSFKDSLANYHHSHNLLPPAVQQMIIAGERSGSLATVLLTIGRTYEQKSDNTSENLQVILEPILLVIVWLGVMLVAVAVILPIYSLVGGLNQ